jgi:hypothetical protein
MRQNDIAFLQLFGDVTLGVQERVFLLQQGSKSRCSEIV